MTNIIHLHSAHETLPEDERVRLVAKRAAGKRDFPFDGLPLGTAMILAQLELSAGLPISGMKRRPGK